MISEVPMPNVILPFKPIICSSYDAYVSAPKRRVWTATSQRFADSGTRTNRPIMTETHTPTVVSHTYRHSRFIIRNTIPLILHRNKNLAVMSYVQINSSSSIKRPQQHEIKQVRPALWYLLLHHLLLLLSTEETSLSLTKMAEKASATRLIRVYRAERQRRVRPLPWRGQIKLKIAHIVVRSIASALLLRALSPLPVLNQKWTWQNCKVSFYCRVPPCVICLSENGSM